MVLRNWKQLKTDRIEPIEIQSRNGNGSGFSISGPDLRAKTLGPDPARLLDEFFFSGARTCPSWALRAPRASLGCGTSGPILWPNKKKKCLPGIDFLANQTGGEKEESRKPIIFLATNRSDQSETNKTHYFLNNQQIGNPFSLQYFPTSKVKTRINIQTLSPNNKTLQNQIKQADPIQPK